MSLRVFISSVLALSMTADALAQGQQQKLSYDIAPVAKAVIPGPPPLPRVSILVSAFRPFQKKETNMAQMVADAIQELSRRDSRYNNITLDRVDLDVVYDSSSEALVQKIRSGQNPDIIISIGQGGMKNVVIETGADSDPSNLADIHGRGRRDNNFPALSEEIGFNFPVQDMYCSLPSESRKKVSISYKGGSFVCNDLAYYMGQYVRPKHEVDGIYRNFESQIRGQYDALVRSIDAQLAHDTAIARAEFDRISREEAPAKAEFEQRVAGIRARNAQRKIQADQNYQIELQRFEQEEKSQASGGSQVTVHRNNGPTYGPPSGFNQTVQAQGWGSNQNYPSQPLRRQPPRPDYSGFEPEPYFPTKAFDRTSDLRNRAEGDKRLAKQRAESSLVRAKSLRDLLGSNGKTRFVFIHVPASDGIAYAPKYQLLDAVCVVGRGEVPNYGDWYEESSASNNMDLSISSLRAKARSLITQSARAPQQSAAPGAVVRSKSYAPEVCENPDGPIYEEEIRDFNGRPTGKFTKIVPAPRGRYYYSMRAYSQKAELKEQSEANSYATTILDMVNGALRRSLYPSPSGLPLPTFSNNKRMPRGESERVQAIATLKNLGYGYVQQSQVLRGPNKYETISTPVGPQMNPAEADCYADVLKKMGQDQKEDKASGPRRY